ncbi:MAG: hypothetical protein LUE11_00410 [Clostridia bacterium]|nr:hypothetical protein [Clostridia bacterium]
MKHIRLKHRPAWDRVKSACIYVLLACNIVLLAVFGTVKGYDAWRSHQTRSRMDSLLAQQGILCGSSVYHTLENCPQAYTLRTDNSMQKALVRTLLTGTVTTEAKGSTTAWNGDNGTVEWAPSGAITASVKLSAVVEPQSAEQAADVVKDLLKKAGISVRSDQITAEDDDSGYIVTVWQEIKGTELVGCSLQFIFAPGNVITVDGIWCAGTPEPLQVRALENYSAQQVLFEFVSAQGAVGQIISVQPAYVLSDKSGGRFATIPCWRFSTDSGDFILNILTGDVVATADLGIDTDTGEDDGVQEDMDTWDSGSTDIDADNEDAQWDSWTDESDTAWDSDADDGDSGYDAAANTEDIWNVDG